MDPWITLLQQANLPVILVTAGYYIIKSVEKEKQNNSNGAILFLHVCPE